MSLETTLGNPKVHEFIRFCIVGVICTAIDAGIFYATRELTGYRIAMVCGFTLSLSVNYVLNIYWSFNAKPTLKNAIGMLAAHCFNIFVVRMALMWMFVEYFCIDESIPYIPTLLISIITNFIILRFIVKRTYVKCYLWQKKI